MKNKSTSIERHREELGKSMKMIEEVEDILYAECSTKVELFSKKDREMIKDLLIFDTDNKINEIDIIMCENFNSLKKLCLERLYKKEFYTLWRKACMLVDIVYNDRYACVVRDGDFKTIRKLQKDCNNLSERIKVMQKKLEESKDK